MKILSIDFDYFQDVTEEQLKLYPDGIDNSTAISEIIWGSHYANQGDELNKISLLWQEFDKIELLLLSQNPEAKVLITQSHKEAYNFVHTNNPDMEKMKLVNADMHHDFTNNNPELDCGNWIGKLAKEFDEKGNKMKFDWVVNPVSLSMYGIEDSILTEISQPNLSCLFDKEKNEWEQFDMIFLCRSDTWTPPHLDKYFTELCDIMKSHFNEINMQVGIDKPRTQYKEYAEQMKGFYKKYKEKTTERE